MNALIPVTSVPVVATNAHRVDVTMPVGSTISDMIAVALPGLSEADHNLLRVSLVNDRGMMVISRQCWPVTRPREGTRVVIRIVPAKNTLRSILMVVVSIAAIVVAPYLAGALGFAAGTTGYSIATGLITAGLTALGALLVNALIPPTATPDQKTNYQISGWKNRVPGKDDVVPWICGKHRYAPPFAASSYTEIVGDHQYIRALFTFGYGPVLLDDFRIGDTSLAEFDEVEIEVRDGREADDPITLYPRQVIEEPVSVELIRPYQRDDDGEILKNEDTEEKRIVRQTASNAASASVILAFQNGLFSVNGDGDYKSLTVDIRIRQRLYGAVDWTEVTTLSISAKKREAFFRQHTWDLPSRGRYEIEVTRMTDERTSNQLSDKCTFAGLQSIRPEYPINFSKPICLVALRIKATYQLSGALDNFNALAQREMPVYSEGTWSDGASSNPFSAFRLALEGNHIPFPASTTDIDLDALASGYDFCTDKGLKFDYVFEEPVTFGDMLTTICAAGRATPRHDGVKWSTVIDRPDGTVIDHLSPRNSSDFKWSRIYFEAPDGFRMSFKDATNDYKTAERIIPWIGHTGPVNKAEDLPLIGKTDPYEIVVAATRRMYELTYRPDTFSCIQSGAARVATRGDLVKGSYDVLTRTQVASRVKSVSDYLIELDETITMDAGQSYGIRFKVYSYDAEENETISSVTSEVRTQVGNWNTIIVKDKSDMPMVGDVVHFGPLANIDLSLMIKGIEPAEDFACVVHAIAAAPIIDELTDAIVVPEWNGIVGEEIDSAVVTPAVPRITYVASGLDGTGDANGLSVLVEVGTGSAAIVTTFAIETKLTADSVWTTTAIPVANGGSDITGYMSGNSVDIRVRAAALGGAVSAYTSTVTVVIGSADPVLPSALDSASITVVGKLGHAIATFATSSDEALAQVQLYRVPTGDALNRDLHAVGLPQAVGLNSSINMVDGDSTRTTLLSNGAFASAASWSLGDGWTISAGKATHATGTAGNIDQAISFVTGKFYRLGFVVSGMTDGTINPMISGGSDRAGAFVSADGSYLDRIQAVTGNNLFSLVADADFDGAVDDAALYEETGACVSQGIYDYYLEPQNENGNPGPASGPFTATIV
nr:phage tail protein [uncultured Cohaesibacter sp.]